MLAGDQAAPSSGASTGRLAAAHFFPFQCMAMKTCCDPASPAVAAVGPTAHMSLAETTLAPLATPGMGTVFQVVPL